MPDPLNYDLVDNLLCNDFCCSQIFGIFSRTISPNSNERKWKLRLFQSKYQALIEQICVSVSEEVISQHELAIKYLTQHNKIEKNSCLWKKKPAKFHFSISSFWVPAMNFYTNTFFLSDVSTFSCVMAVMWLIFVSFLSSRSNKLIRE